MSYFCDKVTRKEHDAAVLQSSIFSCHAFFFNARMERSVLLLSRMSFISEIRSRAKIIYVLKRAPAWVERVTTVGARIPTWPNECSRDFRGEIDFKVTDVSRLQPYEWGWCPEFCVLPYVHKKIQL